MHIKRVGRQPWFVAADSEQTLALIMGGSYAVVGDGQPAGGIIAMRSIVTMSRFMENAGSALEMGAMLAVLYRVLEWMKVAIDTNSVMIVILSGGMPPDEVMVEFVSRDDIAEAGGIDNIEAMERIAANALTRAHKRRAQPRAQGAPAIH